jgi:hypothetical protein
MIVITDSTPYAAVTQQLPVRMIIPTAAEINSSFGPTMIINTTVTSAFINLLIEVSDLILVNPWTPVAPWGPYSNFERFKWDASTMFRAIGFSLDASQNIILNLNANALDIATEMMINKLHNLTTAVQIAQNAFFNLSIAGRANNLRGLPDSGLRKLHVLSVYDNSNLTLVIRERAENNLLNNRDENTDRFVLIDHDSNNDQQMPRIRVYNNSNQNVKFRLKVEYKKYVTDSRNTMGGFGAAEAYDLNNNGTITANERVYLNRKFLDYFPNQANADYPAWTATPRDFNTFSVNANSFRDVDFDDRIRGGEVTLEYMFGNPTEATWVEESLSYIKFHIRGENPSYSMVRDYLISENLITRFWFIVRKIRQETGSYNNLEENHDDYQMAHFNQIEDGQNYSVRKNHVRGLPNFGPPGGYGLGQIDNFGTATTSQVPARPAVGETEEHTINGSIKTIDNARKIVASDQEVWNWKENLIAARRLLVDVKIPELISTISSIRTAVQNWNSNHPTDLVIVPAPINYESIQYSWVNSAITEFIPYNDLFLEGTVPTAPAIGTREQKSFFDAMLLKYYNGATRGHFMSMGTAGNGKPIIRINPLNSGGRNYVQEVSDRND